LIFSRNPVGAGDDRENMRIAFPSESWPPSPVEAPVPAASSSALVAEEAKAPTEFSRLMGHLGRTLDQGERTVERAAHGGSGLGPAELLALQSGIYRYVELVDLTTKLVDRAVGAVKTTLQSGQ
jgi:hypothetical protein